MVFAWLFKTTLWAQYLKYLVYSPAHSQLADLARQMLRDCAADLREIASCRDCYRYANEQREKAWFCKPCR